MTNLCSASIDEINNDLKTDWLSDNEYAQVIEKVADKVERSYPALYSAAEELINNGFEHTLAVFMGLAVADPDECLVLFRKLARNAAETQAAYLYDKYGDGVLGGEKDRDYFVNEASKAVGI